MSLQSNLSLTPFFRQVPSIERCQSVCNFFGPNLIRHIMWLPAITSHGTAIHQTLAYSLSSQFKWQPVEPFSFNLKCSRETFERALLIRRPAIKSDLILIGEFVCFLDHLKIGNKKLSNVQSWTVFFSARTTLAKKQTLSKKFLLMKLGLGVRTF